MTGSAHKGQLQMLLRSIEANEQKYSIRYKLVLHALAVAVALGYEAGIRIDAKEPEWPVAYIELPTGQVTWHLPQHGKEWDGHTTEQKYERINQFCCPGIVDHAAAADFVNGHIEAVLTPAGTQ